MRASIAVHGTAAGLRCAGGACLHARPSHCSMPSAPWSATRGLLTDAADTAAYTEDWRRLYRGRTPAVIRPASTEELAQRRAPVRRGARADRAAGRQHLDGRRRDAGRGRQRIRAQPVAPDTRPRHRSARPDHDDRGRRHAEGGAERGGRGGVPAAAVDLVGRQRADRRRAGGQRRRQQHRALRQCARPGARAGGRAAGRHGVERAAPAAQGQHRLLPAPVVRRLRGHARHHHRRGAEAGAAAARDLRGAVRRRLARGGAGAVRPLPVARPGGDQRVRTDVRARHRLRAAAHRRRDAAAGGAGAALRAGGARHAAPRRRPARVAGSGAGAGAGRRHRDGRRDRRDPKRSARRSGGCARSTPRRRSAKAPA